jgi:tripartite-type tricarboxylate transporter receptor subunit TctC
MRGARRRFLALTAGAAGVAALTLALVALEDRPANAQVPKTIRIVVPFPAGGSADVIARVFGDQISKAGGPTLVIENRPGAGASIGYEVLARAAPDAGTIGIISNSLVINPSLRKVNYDPLADFAPVCNLVTSPQVIVVNSASPYRTLGELMAAARARPGELTFASLGPATTQHIGVAQLLHLAKADFTYVPYPGGAPATTALLGEHVAALLENYSEAVEHLKAGKFRALAVTTAKRLVPLPDVPTVAEQGFPGYAVEAFFGIAAPARTPAASVGQLAGWFKGALGVDEVKAKLQTLELYPAGACEADFSAQIRAADADYRKIISDAKITAE